MANITQTTKAYRHSVGLRTSENDSACASYFIADPKTKQPILSAGLNGGLTNAGIKVVSENFQGTDTADQIAIIGLGGAAYVTTTAVAQLIFAPSGNVFAFSNIGTQTLPPVIVANGLDIGGDQTNTEGRELFGNFLGGVSGRPFVVGSDRSFFFETRILVADISGLSTLLIGFRRAAVNDVTYTNYADYAALGIIASANPAALYQLTGLNGTDVQTDTTQTLADATAYTVRVTVGATGIVTFKHDAGNSGGVLAPPTVTAAFTFDDGDPVIPFAHIINAADLAGEVAVQSWKVGYSS